MRTAGAWERGGTNLSVRRPGITCPDVLDQRDARPQPLRGRQRLWWPTVLIVAFKPDVARSASLSACFERFAFFSPLKKLDPQPWPLAPKLMRESLISFHLTCKCMRG